VQWQRDFGGLEGRLDGQPQVYIMCIIDILQAYDTGKKLENLIKSQMSEEIGKKEISAVNPKVRFCILCNRHHDLKSRC